MAPPPHTHTTPHPQSYLAELVFNDGFCQISCGCCPCCVAPAALLQKLGATRFLQVGCPSLPWACARHGAAHQTCA